MKPLVIYHDNCADGFGAAFAAWLKLGDEAEYRPMQYGKVPEPQDLRDMVDCRDVYVLDFSLPKAGMDELFASSDRVVWLDHHKTAFEMWCGEYHKGAYREGSVGASSWYRLDDNKSGALLAWEYFHPGTETPLLIQHIDDYDRWQFKLDGTKALNKALWSYAPWNFAQWEELNRQLNAWDDHCGDFPHYLFREGDAILRAHDANVASVVKGGARGCRVRVPHDHDAAYALAFAKPYDGREFDGIAANCPPHLTSDVGYELATQSGTFGLCWCLSQEGLIANCSLRSNGDYDVSAIAKAFGGGGHRAATGFEVPIATLLGWLK